MPEHLRRRAGDHDPSVAVTKEDLWDVRDTLAEAMASGFKGVHERQDKTNGRVNSAHEQLREQDTKIRNLEREIFDRPRASGPPSLSAPSPGEQAGVTRRDVAMFSAGGAALGAAVTFLWKVLPVLLKGLTP